MNTTLRERAREIFEDRIVRPFQRLRIWPHHDDDRVLCVKAAVLTTSKFPAAWLTDAVSAVEILRPARPFAYLRTCLATGAAGLPRFATTEQTSAAVREFNELLQQVPIPAGAKNWGIGRSDIEPSAHRNTADRSPQPIGDVAANLMARFKQVNNDVEQTDNESTFVVADDVAQESIA